MCVCVLKTFIFDINAEVLEQLLKNFKNTSSFYNKKFYEADNVLDRFKKMYFVSEE